MLAAISTLLRYLVQALIVLVEFLVIVFLGILVAIIYAFPWLLRIGAILIWFYGGYRLVIVVDEIYAPFSPEIPVMILQFFVDLLLIGRTEPEFTTFLKHKLKRPHFGLSIQTKRSKILYATILQK